MSEATIKRQVKRVKKSVKSFFKSNFQEIDRKVNIVNPDNVDLDEESRFLTAKSLLKPELEQIESSIEKIILQEGAMNESELAIKQLGRLLTTEYSLKTIKGLTDDHSKVFLFEMKDILKCASVVDYSRNDEEDSVLLTGPEFSNIAFPNRIVEYEKEKSSGGIRSDDKSLAEKIIQLDDTGYRVLALAHSHPGDGKPAPSPRDREQQDLFEEIDMNIINLIFTSNGYLRFYTNDLDFNLLFYGKGIRRVSDELYKINV